MILYSIIAIQDQKTTGNDNPNLAIWENYFNKNLNNNFYNVIYQYPLDIQAYIIL